MKPSIEIIPEDFDAGSTNLICELSETAFTYIFKDKDNSTIHGLVSYPFEAEVSAADIPGILKNVFAHDSILGRQFNKIFVSYSSPESVLMPSLAAQSTTAADLISLVHGEQPGTTVFTDHVSEKNIYNYYRIPTDLHQFLINHFPLIAFAHQSSTLIKSIPDEGNVMQVIFYRDKTVVMLSKSGSLQIIQSFVYASPQDIIYNLLNVCNQFGAEEVKVFISGMIDPESGLYKEVRKYFVHMEIVDSTEGVDLNGTDIPAHYFAHIFSVAKCV